MKSYEEIQDQIDLTLQEPNKFPGMTYADGVRYALEWVIGQNDTPPMED